MEHPMHFRFLAGVLAAGGILWGILSVAASTMSQSIVTWLVFMPGYIITIGYIIRCIYTPQILWRRVIWGASTLVQGLWVVFYFGALGYGVLRYGVGVSSGDSISIIGDVANLFMLWWIFALCISIYGYRFDKRPKT
jgi:hypothetical protein